MTLVYCPDCGRTVSDAAPACPHCGRPIAAPLAPPPPAAAPPYAPPETPRYGAPETPRHGAPGMHAYPPPGVQPYGPPGAQWDPVVAAEKPVVHVSYGVMAATTLTCVALLVGGVLAHVKRDSVRGTWLESHYDWLIATFWQTMGLLVLAIVVGFGLMSGDEDLGAVAIVLGCLGSYAWLVYRVIRGWLRLSKDRPAPNADPIW